LTPDALIATFAVATDNSIKISDCPVSFQFLNKLGEGFRNTIILDMIPDKPTSRQRWIGCKASVRRQVLAVESRMKTSNPAPNRLLDIESRDGGHAAPIGKPADADAKLVMSSVDAPTMKHANKLPYSLVFR
jgi:hypothetical protein